MEERDGILGGYSMGGGGGQRGGIQNNSNPKCQDLSKLSFGSGGGGGNSNPKCQDLFKFSFVCVWGGGGGGGGGGWSGGPDQHS